MAGVSGRVALVTGAGSAGGIGFAIAHALVAGGATVCVTARTGRGFALSLASKDASYVTGAGLVVDGGNMVREMKGG
jgi:NAD(P)-dependent dehydrogenase (short-subunit alcohol dehydrogenase family)